MTGQNAPAVVGCPLNSMVYNQHFTEVMVDDLLPENWGEEELDELLDDEDCLESILEAPPGWETDGYEYHPHKDANGILVIYWKGGHCVRCGYGPDPQG